MAAVDSQIPENNDNNINNHVEENRSDNKTRSSENADICANGNEEEDESEVEKKHVFHVKKILDFKIQNETKFYKVRWDDTWEPEYNLYGCMELINEFLEKRKKEKGKDKKFGGEEEEAGHKGGYCLREKSDVNKKKRKGNAWTTRRVRQKRRRQQPQDPSSSDEGSGMVNSEQSDQSDDGNSDSQPFGILSPQEALKKIRNKKRLTQKRKKINHLFNGIDDSDDDDKESPVEKPLTPMEPVNDAEDTPVPQSPDTPPTPQAEDPVEDNASTDTTQNVETTVTSSVTATVTTAVSTITTTPTISKTTDTCSSAIASWQRLNKTTKGTPIFVGDDPDEETPPVVAEEVKVKEEPESEDEEEVLFKRTAKIKASYVIRKLCESGDIFPSADGEDEPEVDVPPFRSNPSLNTNLPPVRIRQEEEEAPNTDTIISNVPINMNGSPHVSSMSMAPPAYPYDRNGINVNNNSPAFVNKTSSHINSPVPPHSAPIRILPKTLTQPVPVSIRPHAFTFADISKPRNNNFTIPSRPPLHSKKQTEHNKQNIRPVVFPQTKSNKIDKNVNNTTLKPVDDDKDDVICIDKTIIQSSPDRLKKSGTNTNQTPQKNTPVFPSRFNHTRANAPADSLIKKLNIPLECNKGIKDLENPYVEAMLTRILFHVKKLIELLRLEPTALPDTSQDLIIKGVVLTIKETYRLDKCDKNFVETQVNDLTQIALNELPYEKLMALLYNHFVPKPNLSQLQSKDNLVASRMNLTKPTTCVASPVTSINTETQTSKAPVGGPPVLSRGPLVMGVSPMRMLLGQFPVRPPPAGYAHPVRFIPRPRIDLNRLNLVSSGNRPVISHLHPANRLPSSNNRLPNSVIPELHRLPHPILSNLHPGNRLPNPLYTSPTVHSTNATSLVVTPGIVLPPPITVINSLPGLASENSTSLPWSITDVRSLKVTQANVEPVVESIDIQDDDVKINGDTDHINNSTSGTPSHISITSKVKTVLGPHRFYKPPKNPLSESRPVSLASTKTNDIITKIQLNLAKRDQIRYKDLVNQKFAAKPVTDSDKVVDLTEADGGIVSLDESDKDDKSDEEKSDKESRSDETS